MQLPKGRMMRLGDGLRDRPDRAAAGRHGRLHPLGALSAALHRSDDGDPGSGGGRSANLRGLSPALVGDPGDGGVSGRRQGISDGRRARHRRVRFRDRDGAQGGPDRRTGQHLRGGGEETAGRRSRHRLRGGSDRDPDHRRGRQSARCWRRTCWPRRSTMWRLPRSWSRPTRRLAAPWPREVEEQLRTLADGADRACGHRAATAPSSWSHRSRRPWSFRTASRPSTSASRCGALLGRHHQRRQRVHRPEQPGGGRGLRLRSEPRAADVGVSRAFGAGCLPPISSR